MLGIFGEDLGQCLSLKISVRPDTSRRRVPTTRSQIAFARDAWDGVLMIRPSSPPEYTDPAISAAGSNPYGTAHSSGNDAPGEVALAAARHR